MKKSILSVLLSLAMAVPATASPFMVSSDSGIERQGDVVTVAAKRKKRNTRKQVMRNPRNGDVLIGRVDGFKHHQRTDGRRVREGDDLGGLIGEAVNNFMFNGVPRGRHTRRTGPNEVPDGGYGQTCGPQYWTSTPTSPAC